MWNLNLLKKHFELKKLRDYQKCPILTWSNHCFFPSMRRESNTKTTFRLVALQPRFIPSFPMILEQMTRNWMCHPPYQLAPDLVMDSVSTENLHFGFSSSWEAELSIMNWIRFYFIFSPNNFGHFLMIFQSSRERSTVGQKI